MSELTKEFNEITELYHEISRLQKRIRDLENITRRAYGYFYLHWTDDEEALKRLMLELVDGEDR